MVPRTVSLAKPYEKSKTKHVRGTYASSDRAGKTRTALLEKRTDRCGFAPSEKLKNTTVI